MASNTQCPSCRGTGWIEVETPRGPAAQRCVCFQKSRATDATLALGLPPRFADADFDSFSAGSYKKQQHRYNAMTSAMRKAQRFADEFPLTKARGLLFQGGSPQEQSHIAVATLKRMVQNGFSGVYFDYQHLLTKLRSRSDPNPAVAEAARNLASRIADVDVLLLDSLGEHRATEWAVDTVSGIIKHLYHHRKCLLATTGLPLSTEPNRTEEGPEGMVMYQRVNDNLGDRIGQESVQRLIEHCELVSMAVREPVTPQPKQPPHRRH